jgi:hypothetical protein
MGGQDLQVRGSEVQLPPGDILGSAFYEDMGMFFVQQDFRPTDNGGLILRSHRQLSSWNIESHAMITKRVIDEIPFGAFPCGRIQISTTSHLVYLCSAESHLEILAPDTLETVGTMAHEEGQTIVDFAIDDPHDRVLVLSARNDGSIILTIYSRSKEREQQETVLIDANSSHDFLTGRNDLVSVSRSGQIGIYLDGQRGFIKSTPGIYMCKDTPDLSCVKASDDDRTSWVQEMSFLGQDILVASSKLADDRWDCISSVSPGYKYSMMRPLSFGASRKYCSPTGVHYAVGVVEDKCVVGFTGVDKVDFFSGFDKPVSSSFSVWRAGTSKVAAVVKIPTVYGIQSAFRIVASNTEPLFIAYHGMSNTLYMYSIADH